jgi:hypothetical protein
VWDSAFLRKVAEFKKYRWIFREEILACLEKKEITHVEEKDRSYFQVSDVEINYTIGADSEIEFDTDYIEINGLEEELTRLNAAMHECADLFPRRRTVSNPVVVDKTIADIPPVLPPTPLPGVDKHKDSAVSYKLFNTRMFGTSEEDAGPVYTTILPKGTLLFRGIRTPRQLQEDLFGKRLEKEGENVYCISRNYVIYFYPFPFLDQSVSKYPYNVTYILKKDVEIAVLINPSPLFRGLRHISSPSIPIQSCDKEVPFGCGLAGRAYDPCFKKSFQDMYPSVTGLVAIANEDRERLHSLMNDTSWKRYADYFNTFYSFYTDQQNTVPSVPEIVLYPFDGIRPEFKYVVKPGELSTDANVYGIYYMCSSPGGTASATPDFETYITQLTSPDGYKYNGVTLRAQIDKTTGFFVDPSIYTGDAKNLLPANELARMGESFPELRFTRATSTPPAPSSKGGRKRTFRRRTRTSARTFRRRHIL